MTILGDGINAHNLLNDELLQRTIEAIKEDLKARIVSTRPKEKETREELYNEYQGVIKFEQKLKSTLDNGNLSRKRQGD